MAMPLAACEGARRRLPQSRPSHLSCPVRRPLQPGEFLQTRYLAPLGISQTELALALGVSRRRVNELVKGRRAVTPDTAVRLGAFLGTEAAFWMHLQVAWDMHGALQSALVAAARSIDATQAPRPIGR